MKAVTADQMREIDRLTMSEFDVPGHVLMDRAGFGVAQTVDELARVSGFSDAPVRLFAGRGNNGGDVFVAARYLKERGYRVEVWLAGEKKRISGDALRHLERMKQSGIEAQEVTTPQEWEDMAYTAGAGEGMVVDGILGIGTTGPARGTAAAAIHHINFLRERCPVVSVDIPSGLNADTGEAEGDTVCADVTVTMGLPKRGLLQPRAVEYVGAIEVIDLGFPDELVGRYESDLRLISSEDVRAMLPRRPRDSHKGMFGHALVIGGAPGYSGAITLAAGAALRSGVGLVSGLVPRDVVMAVATRAPEAMIHPGQASDSGALAADALTQWGRSLDGFDAILVGPGMTTQEGTRALVCELLKSARQTLVLDADALNVLAGDTALLRARPGPTIVTPHPAEMARLTGRSVAEIQADRFGAAREAANAWNAVVVLKGAGTVVASPGQALWVNATGNPGMARGGMGDVLAGLIAGLAAQGMPAAAAAAAGVYLHGRAGDRVAWTGSQAGLLAGDLVADLTHTFAELTPR